jgi:hypothetical protein
MKHRKIIGQAVYGTFTVLFSYILGILIYGIFLSMPNEREITPACKHFVGSTVLLAVLILWIINKWMTLSLYLTVVFWFIASLVFGFALGGSPIKLFTNQCIQDVWDYVWSLTLVPVFYAATILLVMRHFITFILKYKKIANALTILNSGFDHVKLTVMMPFFKLAHFINGKVRQKSQIIEQASAGLLVVLFSLFIGIIFFVLFTPDGRFDISDFQCQLIFGIIVILFCFIVWSVNKWNAYNLLLTGVIIAIISAIFVYYSRDSNKISNMNYLLTYIWPITTFPAICAACILLVVKSIRNKSNVSK